MPRYSLKNSQLDEFAYALETINKPLPANFDIQTNEYKNFLFMKHIRSLGYTGSKNVDKDLSYVYKCSLEDARNIKENFAISLASYADTNDSIKVRSEKEEV